MGLDIYSGTLTRYYAHNWKNVVQQWAEAKGYEFNIIRPNADEGEQEETLSPEEILNAVTDWSSQLIAAMNQNYGREFEPWNEDYDTTPYFTDKPDWDAFMALVIYTCCKIYNEPVPETVVNNFDVRAFPIVERAEKDNEVNLSLLKAAVWWVPLDESFYANGPLPNGVNSVIGTVKGLEAELMIINGFEWNADEETILSWSKTEGYNAEEFEGSGFYSKTDIPEGTVNDTVSLAKFAFSLLWQSVRFAKEHNVPIVLDF